MKYFLILRNKETNVIEDVLTFDEADSSSYSGLVDMVQVYREKHSEKYTVETFPQV